MPTIIPQYEEQRGVSGFAGRGYHPRNAEAAGAPFRIAAQLMERIEERAQIRSAKTLNEVRHQIAVAEQEEYTAPLGDGEFDYVDRVKKRVAKIRLDAINGTKGRIARTLVKQAFDENIEPAVIERVLAKQALLSTVARDREIGETVTAGVRAVELDPFELPKVMEEFERGLDGESMLPQSREAHRAAGRLAFVDAAERARARTEPEATLGRLAGGDASLDSLPADRREQIRAIAEDGQESSVAGSILSAYRTNVRHGDTLLAKLDESPLSTERQDGIRRKVRDGVNLMRDERQAEHLNLVAALETRIAIGARPAETFGEIESLYRSGALSPSQVVSFRERATINATKAAEDDAARRELMATIDAGLPLDRSNAEHRKFLASAFTADSAGLKPGGAQFRGLALSYASRVRMLPEQASSWLRSSARSPDPRIAMAGAEFYGALEEQAPEAAGDVDPDTRAFLAQFSGMLAAGTPAQAAFETSRTIVFEARKDVLEARTTAYREHAKSSDSALAGLIDRDFDTAFTSQPAATSALRADFDAQTSRYFQKVGDVQLARDLAWKDLRRVYGRTEVNGEPVIAAFPVERFGVTPAEARQDVTAFLRETGQDLRAEDVLIVPDGLTLRAVGDALSGKQVLPSYRLVTKDGDLVLGADGVPARYTLPTHEELTARFKASQARARQEAAAAVAEAKMHRELIERAEAYRRGPK